MTDEALSKMKPEEAIIEIRLSQVKHNKEIKQLHEELNAIKQNITASNMETTNRVGEEFEALNNKLAAHMTSTNDQIKSGIAESHQTLSGYIKHQVEKLREEAKATSEENGNAWKCILKEIQDLKCGLMEEKDSRHGDEQTQQTNHNTNTSSFSIPLNRAVHNQETPLTMGRNNLSFAHSTQAENSGNRIQTLVLPPSSVVPSFSGKQSERPRQFLGRVEEYAETTNMWNEDMLVRNVSQFLKDNALEWYCQLRTLNYLPKTWAEFKQEFTEQFNSPLRMAQQRQQWNECKQNKDEGINDFHTRLRAIWGEQYPQETETEFIKHFFHKMRPEIMTIVGCPRNNSLREIIREAQQAEELLFHQAQQRKESEKVASNGHYTHTMDNANNTVANASHGQPRAYNRPQNQYYSNMPQPSNTNQNQQVPTCYRCGRTNHRANECWYPQQYTNNQQYQWTQGLPKNE